MTSTIILPLFIPSGEESSSISFSTPLGDVEVVKEAMRVEAAQWWGYTDAYWKGEDLYQRKDHGFYWWPAALSGIIVAPLSILAIIMWDSTTYYWRSFSDIGTISVFLGVIMALLMGFIFRVEENDFDIRCRVTKKRGVFTFYGEGCWVAEFIDELPDEVAGKLSPGKEASR